MTETQRILIQDSFTRLEPEAAQLGTLFYNQLFLTNPSLRHLFPADMQNQKRKLVQMLRVAVKNLEYPKQLIPVLEDLGRRHAQYGVQDHHYHQVGAALLWALAESLGAEFCGPLQEAWAAAYQLIATTMQNAARTVVAYAATA